jgi:DNA-binding MarR family transcriptional regulator
MAERPDLAAMTAALSRALTAAERPHLERHGLTMWAYIVLTSLGTEPWVSQKALADSIRADRTRIITVLDDLQDRGLVTREPDPADRRVRLIALTAQGRELRDAAQADIQRNEERLLSVLPADERIGFVQALERLARAAPEVMG